MIPLRHRRWWIAMSLTLVVVLVYASLVPDLPIPAPGNFDKVEHFTTYCGLAVWFMGLYPRSRYWTVVAALLALGGGLEIAQGMMGLGRTADIRDMAANTAGVGVGLLLALTLTGNWARRLEAWTRPE